MVWRMERAQPLGQEPLSCHHLHSEAYINNAEVSNSAEGIEQRSVEPGCVALSWSKGRGIDYMRNVLPEGVLNPWAWGAKLVESWNSFVSAHL